MSAAYVVPTAAGSYSNELPALGAMGFMVHVEPDVFLRLVSKADDPLVLHSRGGFMRKHRWALAHRGYLFWTATRDTMPMAVETVAVKRLWVPSGMYG